MDDAPGEEETRRERTGDPPADPSSASQPADTALALPVAGERYRMLERLGQGAMGVVYAAEDRVLARKVALKLLRAGSAPHDERSAGRARMLREAQALARLNHPNVVTVHDAGLLPSGEVFVAMQLVSGTTLRAWLDEDRDWRQIVEVFVAAGRGLAAAHAVGIVHRDFKPDNVLVGEDGAVQVTDFGLARAFVDGKLADTALENVVFDTSLDDAITQAGIVIGTPAYMPPEQHRGAASDPKGDQFAFCVALYEALWKQRPFIGRDRAELVRQMDAGEIPRPATRPSGPPFQIAEILRLGLSPDPAWRHPDMHTLLRLLEQAARPRRRPWLVWAAVGAAAIGGAIALLREAAPPPCAALDAPIAAVYDDAVKADLRDALEKASPAGEGAWLRIEPRLDTWASAWIDARTDACRATRVRGEQSEHLLDLRMQCLDDRLLELEAYLDALRDPDAGVAERAVQALRALGSVDACADGKTLASRLPPPGDPAVAARVEDLRARLTRIQAAVEAGRYEEMLGPARDLDRDAVATGHAPFIAEAHSLLGRMLILSGDNAEAEAILQDAIDKALASGHDRVLARAAVALSAHVGKDAARSADAQRLSAQADAALVRIGDPLDLRTRWHEAETFRAKERADWETAERHLMTSLELRRNRAEDDDEVRAQLLNELGDLRRRQGREADAIRLLEEALELRRAALGERHPEIARDLNNLGLALGAADRHDEALARLTEALEIMRTGYPEDHPEIARIHNNLGMTLSSMGRYDEASRNLQAALEAKRERLGESSPALGSTYANLAVVEMRRGNFSRASTLFEQGAVAFSQGLPPEHPMLGQIHASMAEVSLALGDLVSARHHADATEPARVALPAGDEGRFAIDAAHVRVLLAAGDADAAMQLARRHHEDVASSDAAAPVRAGADVLLALALALAGDEQAAMPLAQETIARLGELGDEADATHLVMAHALLGRMAGDASRACDHFGAARELLRAHVTVVSPDEKAAIERRAERCAS